MENYLAVKNKHYGYFVIRNMTLDSEVYIDTKQRVDLWFQAYNLEESDYKLLQSLNNTISPNLKFTDIRPLITGFARKIYYQDTGRLISCHEGTFEKGLHAGFGRILQAQYSIHASIGFIVDTYNNKNQFDWGLELTNSLPLGKGIVYHNLNPKASEIYEGIFDDDRGRIFSQMPAIRKNINSFEQNE